MLTFTTKWCDALEQAINEQAKIRAAIGYRMNLRKRDRAAFNEALTITTLPKSSCFDDGQLISCSLHHSDISSLVKALLATHHTILASSICRYLDIILLP
jgi:hypothetical protein